MSRNLVPCTNNLCDHLVHSGTMYCCLACDLADERGYEIHESGPLGHSTECLTRHASRKGINTVEKQ